MNKLEDFKKIDLFLQENEELLEAQIDELRYSLRMEEAFLTDLRDARRKTLADLVGIPEECMEDSQNWECGLSPTQHCIYDLREVDALDNCILCGDALERK